MTGHRFQNVGRIASIDKPKVGIFAGIGVLLAFMYTLVLLPALIAVIPFRIRKTEILQKNNRIMDKMLEAIAAFATTHPKKILFVSALIVAVAIVKRKPAGSLCHPPGSGIGGPGISAV